jgi:NADH-quinone oxidoreductase subunit M
MLKLPILTIITFLPAIGALLILFFKKENIIKVLSFMFSLITFIISMTLYIYFDGTTYKMQFVEHIPWVKDYGISYFVGVDGISLFLVLLTTFITPIAILSSFKGITEKIKGYMVCMLILETGMIGVFISLDLFLFYIFWEVMLVPMYLLIGVWGGPRRIYAAVKFFIYTMFGSLLMLVAILFMYYLNYRDNGILRLYNSNRLNVRIPLSL